MITFGTGTATIVNNDSPTKSTTYTVAAGDDAVLLIAVASERGGGVSGVTVDGNPAIEVVTSTVGDQGMASLWAYDDPPTGSVSIVVTPGDSDEPIFIGADVAYGVDISTITNATVTNSGDSATPSVSIPSASGTVVVGVFGMTNGGTVTATTGTLLCSDHGAGPADVSGGMSWAPGGASASLAWSVSASDDWNAVGAVLTEAPSSDVLGSATAEVTTSSTASGHIGVTGGATAEVATDVSATALVKSTVTESAIAAITTSAISGGIVSGPVFGRAIADVDTSAAATVHVGITASAMAVAVTSASATVAVGITASATSVVITSASAHWSPPIYHQQPGDVVIVRARPPKDFSVRWALWRSNIRRQRIEPLSLAMPTNGEVSYDQNRSLSPHQLTIDVTNPDALRLPGDFVIPELTLVDPDNNETVIPLGHYAITDPEIDTFDARRTARLTGMDLTYLLSLATLPDGGYFGGNDASLHAQAVLLSFGIPFDMIDIPLSGVTVPVGTWYGPGSNRLAVINDLLRIGGMEPIAANLHGVLTSRKTMSLHDLTPSVIYGTESGAYVVPPTSERQPLSEVRNQVVVVYESPGADPVYGVATVTNEASPIHPTALGQAYGLDEPIVQGERITVNNLSGDPLVDGIVTSLLAIANLSRLASYWHPLTVETFIDTHLDDTVLGLDIRTDDTERYTGNWWQRGWTIPMGTRATVRRTVNRLERIA